MTIFFFVVTPTCDIHNAKTELVILLKAEPLGSNATENHNAVIEFSNSGESLNHFSLIKSMEELEPSAGFGPATITLPTPNWP